MSKTTLTRIISIMILILLGSPMGCVAQETVQSEGLYSGHPLVTTNGESWILEEPDDYYYSAFFLKDTGIIEMYTLSPVFGWQKEEEMRFEVGEDKLLLFEKSDSDDNDPDIELTYSIHGQTVTVIDVDDGETLTFTKKTVDLSKAQSLFVDLERDINIYLDDGVLIEYRSREEKITAIELKIDNNMVEVRNSRANIFFGDYDFEENKTYHVSLVLSTETRTYHESATLTIPQKASINVQKSGEDNWWDFPILISWTYSNNNIHSMMLRADIVRCANKEGCFEDEGILEPHLREFPIPVGLIKQHQNCDIGVELENINYVLTDNAYFEAIVFSEAGIISE